MELADTSELSFEKFNALSDVVGRYEFACRDIERESAEFFSSSIRKLLLNAGLALDYLVIKSMETDPGGTFAVFVEDIRDARTLISEQRQIRGFGPIRKIRIEMSPSLARWVNPSIDPFALSIENFHRVFEQKYIALHGKHRETLVSEIHAIMLAASSGNEQAIVRDHCRISVTRPKDNNFRFYISEMQLRRFIEIVSREKFNFAFDPVIAMSRFLYSDDNDFFYKEFREGRAGFVKAYFSDVEASSINILMQKIERLINRAATISCIEVCEYNGFSLQISSAPKYELPIQQLVERCLLRLVRRFEANIDQYNGHNKELAASVNATLAIYASRLQTYLQTKVVQVTMGQFSESAVKTAWEFLGPLAK